MLKRFRKDVRRKIYANFSSSDSATTTSTPLDTTPIVEIEADADERKKPVINLSLPRGAVPKLRVYAFDGISAAGKTTFLHRAKEATSLVFTLFNDYTEITEEMNIYKTKDANPVIDSCYNVVLHHRFITTVYDIEKNCADSQFSALLVDRIPFSNMVYRAIFDYGGDKCFSAMKRALCANNNKILSTIESAWRMLDNLLSVGAFGVSYTCIFICVDNYQVLAPVRRFLNRQQQQQQQTNSDQPPPLPSRNSWCLAQRQQQHAIEFIKSENFLFTLMARNMPNTCTLIELNGKHLSDYHDNHQLFVVRPRNN